MNSTTKPKRTHLFGVLPWTGMVGVVVKSIITLIGVVLAILIVIAILTFTNLDTQIFELTLQGTISNSSGNPISGATVKLAGEGEVNTETNGRYNFGNLRSGEYKLTIKAEGYEELERQITIGRSYLNYTTTLDYSLTTAGIGTITGRFVAEDSTYLFLDDILTVDDQVYELNVDGTFSLSNVPTGKRLLKLESTDFVDVTREFEVKSGENLPLADIEITPAGDIISSVKSYIREDLVLDLDITVEGVSSSNIEIKESGEFIIRDLEVGRNYKIRTSKRGYESRDYEVQIEQGENPIPGFTVTEKGFIPYLAKVDNDLQVFAANADGKNEIRLTTDKKTEPFAEFIDDTIIYYLSTRDGIRSEIGGKALLVYAVSTDGGNAQRITTNFATLGRIIPNFTARKLANITEGFEKEHRKLEIMDLTGNNRKQIQYLESGTFNDVIISDNGSFVFFHMQNLAGDINGLYRASVNNGNPTKIVNKENIQIFSVSADGNRVLYSASNEETDSVELFLFTISTGQDKRVRTNTGDSSQFQFVKGTNDLVVFQAFRQGANNVWQLELDNNKETKLTDFEGLEGVEAVYQQAGYILYQTNKGLYILDIDKPISGKKVTSNVARYTGYDF